MQTAKATGKFPFHDDMFDDEAGILYDVSCPAVRLDLRLTGPGRQAGENWVGSPKMAQIRRRLKVAKARGSWALGAGVLGKD